LLSPIAILNANKFGSFSFVFPSLPNIFDSSRLLLFHDDDLVDITLSSQAMRTVVKSASQADKRQKI